MPTATETRKSIVIHVSEEFSKILLEETEYTGMPLAILIRHIIKWHAGIAAPRQTASPQVRIPKKVSENRISKTVLIDKEDAAYLDRLGARFDFTRLTVLRLVLHAWFELEVAPPRYLPYKKRGNRKRKR